MKNCTFYHGWGYDRKFWNDWILPCSQVYDRGYFGKKLEVLRNTEIIVAHSFGLHFISNFSCKTLIILGGFIEFGQKELVDKMYQEFFISPEKALKKFYRLCHFPNPLVNPQFQRLKQDLKFLNENRLELEQLKKIPNIIIIHGKQDRIVPYEKGLELNKKLPQSRWHLIKDAGHVLSEEQCLDYIKKS